MQSSLLFLSSSPSRPADSMAFASPVIVSTSLADHRFASTSSSSFRKQIHFKRTPPGHRARLSKHVRCPTSATLESQQKPANSNVQENGSVITLPTDTKADKNLLTTPEYFPSIFRIFYDLFRLNLRNVELGRLYGPVYKTKGLFGAVTVITNQNAIVEMSRKPHLFASSDAFARSFIDVVGEDSIGFIDGKKHRNARARVAPAFAQSTIPSYFDTTVNHARGFFQTLSNNVDHNSGPVDIVKTIKKFFLDLIITLTLNTNSSDRSRRSGNSHDCDANSEKLGSLFIQFANAVTLPEFLPASKQGNRASKTLEKELSSILYGRLRDKDARLELKNVRDCLLNDKIGKVLSSRRADLMSVLIASSSLELPENDDEAMFDRKEDKEEIGSLARTLRTLWFAGFTTQSGALSCAIMEIFSDPALLKRLQDEQDSIPNLTAQSVANDMPLLSSTLSESMRVNSPIPALFRRATEDVVILNHLIPEGTSVVMDYSAANMDSTNFQNADDFIPDRFIKKPELMRKALLFGGLGSAHYCIGASLAMANMKTTLAVMMREFDVDVKPWRKRAVRMLPDTQPRDGVWIRSCKPKGKGK